MNLSPPSTSTRPFWPSEVGALTAACRNFPHGKARAHFPRCGVCTLTLGERSALLTSADLDADPAWLDPYASAWLLLARLALPQLRTYEETT